VSALRLGLLTSALAVGLVAPASFVFADAPPKPPAAKAAAAAPPAEPPRPTQFTPTSSTTDGSVTIGGKRIDYTAVAGTIVVYPKGYDDVPQDHPADVGTGDKPPQIAASMFYVAYFRKGEKPGTRPITFLYNGGPGSSTVWLHMGAFGPRRVVTADDTHTPAAPYQLVNNGQSLLDASDLVFIDAPGTGFGRIAGPEEAKDKAFFGIDQDAHAFAEFIQSFLSKYNRWNSPKYLFGESYGTTRSAVLSYMLENDYSIDLNGVMLLSQILNFNASIDGVSSNPGVDLGYEVGLPTYTAVAWYHHKLPPESNPPANAQGLPALLAQVEKFAMGPYAAALAAGTALPDDQRDAIANQLHLYTGLSVDYIKRANLRIEGGEFEKNLLGNDETTGRLDARFSGPSLDPLSKESQYDPQSSSISAAYVATFNAYVRDSLKYGDGLTYMPVIRTHGWDFKHEQPGDDDQTPWPNVMPDLAAAMITNPLLKVQLNQGYYDLATPYYEGIYEMDHLPIPQKLRGNIVIKQYDSGHMVYAHQESLQKLHDNAAAFIASTDNESSSSSSSSTSSPPASSTSVQQ
jgi:carboxypeptidase C (cathepsin A)